MDSNLERQIAYSLLRRDLRQRFLYELEMPEGGLIHKLPRMVESRYVVQKSEKFPTPADVTGIMRENNVGSMCYVISEFPDLYRVYTPLRTALEAMRYTNFPALIVGLPSGFSYLKDTAYSSNRQNCFIKPLLGFDYLF